MKITYKGVERLMKTYDPIVGYRFFWAKCGDIFIAFFRLQGDKRLYFTEPASRKEIILTSLDYYNKKKFKQMGSRLRFHSFLRKHERKALFEAIDRIGE